MDDNEAANGTSSNNNGKSVMVPMEIEEETLSLMAETTGAVRQRHVSKGDALAHNDNDGNIVTRLFKSKTAFAVRNVCLLATLGWMVFLFVNTMDMTVEDLPMDDEAARGPHQSSFGGAKNVNSKAGQAAHENHEEEELHKLELIPEDDNVGQKVSSISIYNTLNHVGHYWHDPHQSPFASGFYKDKNDEDLEKEELEFADLLNKTKDKFGSWKLVDTFVELTGNLREEVDFDLCPNYDCAVKDFPESAWQNDEDYVGDFIQEAKAMVDRMKEGIYLEYDHSSVDHNGDRLPQSQINARDTIFGVLLDEKTASAKLNDHNILVQNDQDAKPRKGVAHMSVQAWDALVRKLLHSLVTNDDFFVVLVGDGDAAGRGNNFVQSSIMQFHYLLEPVLDFMGIRLISRNMGMHVRSQGFSAMAGADVYGEMDILWYSSNLSYDVPGIKDLIYKQSILGGERVPVILTNDPVNLYEDSGKTAWIGNLQPNEHICVHNDGICDLNAHNSVCWVDRRDVEPAQPQNKDIPKEKFPSYRQHQLESRKLAMLVLHALDAALDLWVAGIEEDGFPLKESHWHVGEQYNRVREAVRTNKNGNSACEKLLKDFAMACHMELHGHTEWTPRVTPEANSLRELLPSEMTINNLYEEELYYEVDLFPDSWKIPPNQIDPHLIAISTTAPPPNFMSDDYYDFDDDGNEMNWVYADDDASQDDDGSPARRTSTRRVRQRRRLDAVKDSAPSTTSSEPEKLTPGKGWMMYNPIAGFCDGSAQSNCGRDKSSTCLMAGHNDRQTGIVGDGLSGWLLLRVKNIREGVIFARIQTTLKPGADDTTEGWTTINNEGENEGQRRLNLPDDTLFDYAIDGKVTTLTVDEFHEVGVDIPGHFMLHALFIDSTMAEHQEEKGEAGRTIELGIRIRRGTKDADGRDAVIMLTHLYYA